MILISFLIGCFQAYRAAGPAGVGYFAHKRYGVPVCAVLVARGRSAWQVSDFTANYFSAVPTQPGVQSVR